MERQEASLGLNEIWERRLKENGADFVYFVDISMFPADITEGCPCAILFGKALSKEYVRALRADRTPERKEIVNTERRMDRLAAKTAAQLEAEGYKSVVRPKRGRLPHKSVALRAGLGFIGKHNLLVTEAYGCAVLLGKVMTTAPFVSTSEVPTDPQCGACRLCTEACPTGALLGKTWSLTTSREEIMVRKLCSLCQKCMMVCPYTAEYVR